jgi:hypothetical protein
VAENAPLAMNDAFSGATTDSEDVQMEAPASICFDFDSVSNAINETDPQSKKHDEQRIWT